MEHKKTAIIFASVNILFLLVIGFGYSVISLILLFLFFVSLVGIALNLIYRATSDAK